MIFTAVVLFCGAVYFSVPIVKLRLDAGIGELMHYRWGGVNRDTSVGMRISFYRIGWYFFCQNPLGGWGDHGFKLLLSAPELRKFASDFTIGFTLSAGFHNEVVTNMVRSGVWGLISSLGLFLAPLALFVRGLRSPSAAVRSHALPALGYLVCVLVSGMSTEVFNLKYTASFHAMMLAGFAGSLLMLMRSEHPPQKFMNPQKYSITFACYNQVDYTRQCVESMIRHGLDLGRLVVVDNGSTDQTRDYLRSLPLGGAIFNQANLGCGVAWNQGALAQQAEWTIVMNNDVLVSAGWIENMIDTAERHGLKMISPALVEGELDYDFDAFAATAARQR